MTMLEVILPYKITNLSKFQFILTRALWGPGTPTIWLFVPGTYKNIFTSLNKKDPLNSGRDSKKIM